MTGAEVIANAVRSFRALPPATKPGLWETIAWKILFTMLSAAVMTAAWLAIERRRSRRKPRALPSRLIWRAGRSLGRLLLFAIAMALILLLVIVECGIQLRYAPERAQSIDILFPILAVFLETFVEFAHWLTRHLEAFAAWTLARTQVILSILKRKAMGPKQE